MIADEFDSYQTVEKKQAVKQLSIDEGLNYNKLVEPISQYIFTQKEPLCDDVIGALNGK